MADTLTPEKRSWLMGRVARAGTKPEMIVRRLAHGLGYRFRLQRRDLPGTPDIVFPSRKKVVFVHGCFWHRHDCKKATTPKSNAKFWQEKFARNVERDRVAIAELSELGWEALVVWECQTKDKEALADRLETFLGG